jgi:AsmA protein
MPATVALAPDYVSKITGGKVKPSEPVPLTFRLAGTVTSPRIEGLSVDGAATSLAGQAAKDALGKALGGLGGSKDKSTAKDGKSGSPKTNLGDEAAKQLKSLFGK